MTLHILRLPDGPGDLPSWLEQHFVGDSLGELVRELIVANPSAADDTGLHQILTEQQISEVIEKGLSTLSDEEIRRLIKHPRAMLTLHEQIIVTGSRYWDTKFAAGPLAEQAAELSKSVREQIAGSKAHSIAPATRNMARTLRSPGVLVAVLASTVAIFVAVLHSGPSPSGRILGQPGLTANNTATSAEYFNRLAEAGATWKQHEPANEEQLAKLLTDIINDCEILIEADHDALSTDERTWFRDKCRLWKGKLETNLANLESGSSTFQDTLKATEQVMDKLVEVLRTAPVT